MNIKNIYDISLALHNDTIVYPNNIPVSIETHADMPQSQTKLSKIVMGSHSGTHVDAPAHAVQGAYNLEDIALSVFVGTCRVFDLSGAKDSIKIEDLKDKNIQKGERILVKTSNSIRGFKEFYNDYVYLDGDAADWLKEKEIALFGIDYLSVKQKGSPDQRPHTSLLSKNIPIIEALDLKEIKEGEYTLVCLPLKFVGIEGSPVRAILLS